MSQPVSDFKRSVQDSTKVPGWGKLSLQTPPQTPAHAQAQQASSSSSQQQQQSTSGQDQPNLVPIGGKKKKHKSGGFFLNRCAEVLVLIDEERPKTSCTLNLLTPEAARAEAPSLLERLTT